MLNRNILWKYIKRGNQLLFRDFESLVKLTLNYQSQWKTGPWKIGQRQSDWLSAKWWKYVRARLGIKMAENLRFRCEINYSSLPVCSFKKMLSRFFLRNFALYREKFILYTPHCIVHVICTWKLFKSVDRCYSIAHSITNIIQGLWFRPDSKEK